MTTDDLIAFWSRLGGGTVHPNDDAKLLRDNGFETGLVPLPWNGPIKSARVFVALLNPGIDPRDLPYEQSSAAFRDRLRSNLEGRSSYVYSDERYLDHPGATWASATFGRDLPASAIDDLCIIQLVAYHGRGSKAAYDVEGRLRSTSVIKAWLRKDLLPRVRSGDAALVVGRGVSKFGLEGEPETAHFVRYAGSECRRAYMTAKTRGGAAIRRFLGM